MPQAPLPDDDGERIAVLDEYGVEPGTADETLDGVARAVARVLGVPLALVVLIDRTTQHWPGAHGWNGERFHPLDVEFCGYTVLSDEVLEVGDALADQRFMDNSCVRGEPNIRFYAGAPLITPGGYRLGTVCALDMEPRRLAPWQRAILQDMARTVVDILEGYRRRHALLAHKQQANRLLALGQISASMAHEINNALQPILGMADTLKGRAELGTRTLEFLDTVINSAVHARDVVANVMSFARQDANDIQPHDVCALLDDAIAFVARLMPEGLRVTTRGLDAVRADGGAREVRVSQHGLVQVIQNLVQNASDAMGGHGTVDVHLERCDLSEGAEGARRPAFAVTVADAAPAIDAETRARMFDPFFTTKRPEKGSGLGLSIILGLVEGWGGRIDVASDTETGNRFMVSLPLADAAATGHCEADHRRAVPAM